MEKILIVDKDKKSRSILSDILKKEGFEIIQTGSEKTALKETAKHLPIIILIEMPLPKQGGLIFLEKLREINQEMIVIMLVSSPEARDEMEPLKPGVFDYIAKPFTSHEILFTIKRALKNKNKGTDRRNIKKRIIGQSFKMNKIFQDVRVIAPTDMTIIIQGESGTGKELMAQMIHQKSLRKDKPFIAIDCGSIPETLAESELFGFEKGAFTGATVAREGKFEQAQGGSIFLDEVNNLPESLQMKFLRVIQERKIQRIGGKKEIDIDVRIIVATNINLFEAVQGKNKFRNDLYYRLNEFYINLPPLSQRKEDIPFLVQYFLDQANTEFHKNIKGFSVDVMKILLDYQWPGNIRELKNMIRKTVLFADSEYVTAAYLPPSEKAAEATQIFFSGVHPLPQDMSLNDNIEKGDSFEKMTQEVEKTLIKNALKSVDDNKIKAAEILKINRKTFYRKMKILGL